MFRIWTNNDIENVDLAIYKIKHRKMLYRTVSLLGLVVVLVGSLFSLSQAFALEVSEHASTQEKLEHLDEWLTELNGNSEFNGVVSIVSNGLPVFTKAYGIDGSADSNMLHAHSSFNLASVSKHFTAMAIVLLKADSKLSYSDEISQYIPEMSSYSGVTIRHLLHHTSGLADYIQLAEDFDGDMLTTTDVLSLFQEQMPSLLFSPGSQFDYSNTGYVLLSEIVARASGVSFEKYMQDKIFIPLRMNDSQVFNLLSEKQPENRVYGFSSKRSIFGRKLKSNDLNFYDGVAGDGAVYASAHDLVLWHQALTDNALVSEAIYSDAYISGVLKDGTKTDYGFGWVVIDDAQIEHSGAWQGFSSYLYRNIETNDFVVVLDNSSNGESRRSNRFEFDSIVYKVMELQQSF